MGIFAHVPLITSHGIGASRVPVPYQTKLKTNEMKHLKQEFDKLTFKEAISYGMAFMSLVGGFVLLFIGLFTEPKGQIHESVITAFGIILMFVGAIIGVSMHYASEMSRLKNTLPGIVREVVASMQGVKQSICLDKGKEVENG